ncbi:beta-ketoacyl-[acyl-carrier-protein] synthase family protein [Agaribacterium sp. ZY112]|uniref:beta-ketoacyl-[acyl-carrier-protein] synthase family protein n=1 Tax=Agaribacterium sp. ZY112 TaxID=3233574 RepID=UPI003526C0AB
MNALKLSAYTLSTAVGQGIDANLKALKNGNSGLEPCRFFDINDLSTYCGHIDACDELKLEPRLKDYDCRNNRLTALTLEQDSFASKVSALKLKYSSNRIGVFIGTSTSGIHETERAYIEQAKRGSLEQLPAWYNYQGTHNVYSCAEFVRNYFKLNGYSSAISTACSSSAKVFAAAQRAIALGICDAAIVGGVDSLCLTTLYGFNSLQVIANELCRPSDKNRKGINIGEAAGFAIVEPANNEDSAIMMLAYGESSDAHHMSTPHPDGIGAQLAMQKALNQAKLNSEDINYINLHGTGTNANDLSESRAVCELFGKYVAASSTKGWTGHTLGAAGIIEAIYSVLSIEHQWRPKSLNTLEIDPQINANILLDSSHADIDYVLSNSFGFGGSNCSLIFGGQA